VPTHCKGSQSKQITKFHVCLGALDLDGANTTCRLERSKQAASWANNVQKIEDYGENKEPSIPKILKLHAKLK